MRGQKTPDPPRSASPEEVAKTFARWKVDPRSFIYEALQIQKKDWELSNQQEEAVEEVRKLVAAKIKKATGQTLTEEETMYSKKMGISIMSGKGTGKDWIAAAIILWFLVCHPWCKIPCTANSGKQLKDVLWSELTKLIQGSLIEDLVEIQTERAFFKGSGIERKDLGKRWFATARTVNVKQSADAQAETLRGFHEVYMLVVIDEASGLPYPVFEPLESTLTGLCNIVFMIFNPTRSTGYAIDSQGKHRKDWVCLQWDAEKSDRVDKDHVERAERKYGRNSNYFRVNIKGVPPLADTDTLIPAEWVQDAKDKWALNEYECDPDDPYVFGVDVGAGGDNSVLVHRQGGRVEKIQKDNNPDTMFLTGWIVKNKDDYGATTINIDMVGLGLGVYDRLRELKIPRVYPVDARKRPRNPEKFFRVRDEMWWSLRRRFEAGLIEIPDDDDLIGELSTMKYSIDSSGKIKVESKKDMRKRGIESANVADALCMSFYNSDTIFKKRQIDAYDDVEDDDDGGSWMGA
ncbi:MAG: hypothetical protein KAJ19_14460 [Gammaproteobacteria bacterium]|nr:hypothetical protein [Gammaproteobacteria bacterium]